MSDIKVCKDCEYYRPLRILLIFKGPPHLAKCGRSNAISVVSGEPVSYCSIERDPMLSRYDSTMCGVDAKFFKEKQ